MTNTVQLGSAFQDQVSPTAGLQQMIDSITRAVLAEVQKQMKQPVVNVSPPNVNVAAPQVRVDAPTVTPEINVVVPDIEMPEMGPMTCTVEMPGIDRLVNVLERMLTEMSRPVDLTVQHERGFIVGMTSR